MVRDLVDPSWSLVRGLPASQDPAQIRRHDMAQSANTMRSAIQGRPRAWTLSDPLSTSLPSFHH
jgi:hypothetical protein